MSSYDDWCRAWSERGARARRSPRRRSPRNTSSPPANACNAPASALSLRVVSVRQRRSADEGRAQEGGRAAAMRRCTASPPGERVENPVRRHQAGHGILRKPLGVTKPPVMVMACGLDSTRKKPRPMRRRSWRAASPFWWLTAPAVASAIRPTDPRQLQRPRSRQ